MAKFEVQHDLSLAPSYVKPFVPFDLPSATGVDPTVTSLVTLNASFAPDSSGTPGAHSLNSADTRGLSSEGSEELPFDPIWLTTAGLVGASWHTNVLAAPVSVLSVQLPHGLPSASSRPPMLTGRILPGY